MILPVLLLALTADLEIVAVAPSKTEVRTDETYSFTVRVRNHGPDAAESVKVNSGLAASCTAALLLASNFWM